MEKTIEIPEGYAARIEGNKVIIERKESEDERIRKQLIGFLSGRYALCNINTKDAIAYLERQKEQKPAEWSEDMKEARNNLISVCRDWEFGKQTTLLPIVAVRARYFLEHLTEPKPADKGVKGRRSRIGGIPEYIKKKAENFLSKMEPPYDADDICSAYETGAMESIKFEWSEKDEKNFLDIDCLIHSYRTGNSEHELSRWLKSLRPQPKQDISIGFMVYLDEHRPEGKMCLSNGECKQIYTAFKNQDWDTIIKYIEKYRSHWKPSEEQMNALERAIVKMHTPDDIGILAELRDNLKKLQL